MRANNISKYVSLTILAVLLLSIVPIIPISSGGVAKAQTITVQSITSSRSTGTIYYNDTFYVDVNIWTDSTAPDNLTIAMQYSGGYTYQLNATRIGTTLTYRVWLKVTGDGTLEAYEAQSDGSISTSEETLTPPITLAEGDTLTFQAGGKSLTLTFNATEPTLSGAPDELILPIYQNNSGTYTPLRTTEGWTITAPDLNKDPDTLDNYTIYVEISSNNFEATNVSIEINETAPNSGVFNITTNAFNFDNNNDLKGNFSANVSAGDTVTMTFYIPKSPGNTENWTLTKEFTVAAAPSISVSVDRDVLPLSGYRNMSVYVEVTDTGHSGSTADIYVDYENISGNVVSEVGPIALSEEDTGIYAGWITVNVTNLPPQFINGKVVIVYEGSDGEDHTATIQLKVFPATLTVNGSSTISACYGQTLTFKLNDPELNSNASKYDTVTLNISVGSETYHVLLNETGTNTGVFVGKGVLAEDGDLYASPGETIQVTFTAKRSTSTTPDMESWLSDSLAVEINVLSHTGKITTDKANYGPFDTITITITDPDMNTHYQSKDSIPADQIFIKAPDGSWIHPSSDAEETGDNTGVFQVEVPISDLGTPGDVLKMGSTDIIYKDLQTPNGIQLISTKVHFISWTAKILTDKEYYNLGEKINITVIDPDANEDPNTIDILTDRLMVTSTTDPTGVPVTLVETGPDTGVFHAEILITDHAVGSGYILAHLGDQINITYTDEYPANYAGEPEKITKTVMVGVPVVNPIKTSTVEFVNPLNGQSITPKVGQMVGIDVAFNNTAYTSEKFTVIMVIRDAQGVAVNIQWQTVTLPPGMSGSAGFSWTPSSTGSYTVEIHIIKSLSDWSTLGQMATTTLNVTQ